MFVLGFLVVFMFCWSVFIDSLKQGIRCTIWALFWHGLTEQCEHLNCELRPDVADDLLVQQELELNNNTSKITQPMPGLEEPFSHSVTVQMTKSLHLNLCS